MKMNSCGGRDQDAEIEIEIEMQGGRQQRKKSDSGSL
jgi:hypothetical protein